MPTGQARSVSLAREPTSLRGWGVATMLRNTFPLVSTEIKAFPSILLSTILEDMTSHKVKKENKPNCFSGCKRPQQCQKTLPEFQRKTPTPLVFRGARLMRSWEPSPDTGVSPSQAFLRTPSGRQDSTRYPVRLQHFPLESHLLLP